MAGKGRTFWIRLAHIGLKLPVQRLDRVEAQYGSIKHHQALFAGQRLRTGCGAVLLTGSAPFSQSLPLPGLNHGRRWLGGPFLDDLVAAAARASEEALQLTGRVGRFLSDKMHRLAAQRAVVAQRDGQTQQCCRATRHLDLRCEAETDGYGFTRRQM